MRNAKFGIRNSEFTDSEFIEFRNDDIEKIIV